MAENEAIAIVELHGLPTAIAFADTAVKAANVKLIGYELSKGEGLVSVKIKGNVGAIKAAVNAGSVTAALVGGVYGKIIIPRPSESLERMIRNKETVGYDESGCDVSDDSLIVDSNQEVTIKEEVIICVVDNQNNDNEKIEIKVTCNLCHKPECKRKKGEPRSVCIEFSK